MYVKRRLSLERKNSPLRYPGGKTNLYKSVKTIIDKNHLTDIIYTEPFSGGYGIGLQLMINGDVQKFIINDYDYHIYAFWKTVFLHTQKLVDFITNVDITIEEWHKQKEIYLNYKNHSIIDVGCSTLFLNRTNYSGILKGGPIGGFDQGGEYKINCRFNKVKIISDIKAIAAHKKQVEIYNLDAIKLIRKLSSREKIFYNFDPPYVQKGKELYENFYKDVDHIKLHDAIGKFVQDKWIMTYDKCDFIKKLYEGYYIEEYSLTYVAGEKKKGKEYLISNFNTEEKK